MKTLKKVIFELVLSVILLTGCSKNGIFRNASAPATATKNTFAKGADISWLPQMEATGYQSYNDKGEKEDCFKILKDHGINSIRLRTFVNPSDNRASGHCSKSETVSR